MHESFLPLVRFALSEDVGTGDVTTLNAVPANVGARAAIVAGSRLTAYSVLVHALDAGIEVVFDPGTRAPAARRPSDEWPAARFPPPKSWALR